MFCPGKNVSTLQRIFVPDEIFTPYCKLFETLMTLLRTNKHSSYYKSFGHTVLMFLSGAKIFMQKYFLLIEILLLYFVTFLPWRKGGSLPYKAMAICMTRAVINRRDIMFPGCPSVRLYHFVLSISLRTIAVELR